LNIRKTGLTILLTCWLLLSACEFPGYRGVEEASLPAVTSTPHPTREPTMPMDTPAATTQTDNQEPTQEPTPEPVPEEPAVIPIGIDNVEQLAVSTRIETGMKTIIAALDLSKDGRYLAISQWGDPEVDVRLWDFQEEQLLPPLDFHTAIVTDVAFSPDGEWLASCSQNGEVALWDVGSWELARSFSSYERGASALAFSPDGSLLAVGGQRNQLGVWRLADFERVNYFEQSNPFKVEKIVFTADGSRYFADTGYADVSVWNTADGELVKSFRGEACIGGFDLSSDEFRLAYSSECSDAHEPHDPLARVAVRDVESGEALVYGDRKEDSTILVYTVDDTLIITNNRNRLRFWDAADGSLVYQLPTGVYYVEFMLSDDGSVLIVGGGNGDISVYEVESPQGEPPVLPNE
jgi:WD40 repeat protein